MPRLDQPAHDYRPVKCTLLSQSAIEPEEAACRAVVVSYEVTFWWRRVPVLNRFVVYLRLNLVLYI